MVPTDEFSWVMGWSLWWASSRPNHQISRQKISVASRFWCIALVRSISCVACSLYWVWKCLWGCFACSERCYGTLQMVAWWQGTIPQWWWPTSQHHLSKWWVSRVWCITRHNTAIRSTHTHYLAAKFRRMIGGTLMPNFVDWTWSQVNKSIVSFFTLNPVKLQTSRLNNKWCISYWKNI